MTDVRTAYVYAAQLLRVVDADTLDVAVDLGWRVTYTARVRLLGVDAPEPRTPTGRDATAWVDGWFTLHAPGGGPVLLHTRKPADHDKYGRFLATVVAADGACLNRDLLTAHMATPYD